ncbi:MAG: right-handed parallel beta-helix repeat-containing protein [Planctomycetota bacterium]
MMCHPACCLLFSAIVFWVAPAVSAEVRKAPPLPRAHRTEVIVHDIGSLKQVIENARDNTTILIADGTYRLGNLVYMRAKKNVTLRGASADPAKVILSGVGWDSENKGDDILRIGDCENVTVAHLTFSDCHGYGIKVEAENHPRNINIYNCHFRDIGTRAIKGSGGRGCALGGSIRYCHFENAKTPPAHWLFGGNYISAIDMMALDGWTISDNVFKNIKGRGGSARAAIFVWVRSKNVTVERNLIVDCDRGVAFGNPSASSSQVTAGEYHVARSICRNNFILPGPDAGIELWWVDGVKIYNNTVWRRDDSGRGIRFGSRNKGVHIANNLVRGAIMPEGDGAPLDVRLENNVTGPLEDYFVDPSAGDLRITPRAAEALNAGIPLPDVTEDFDGRPRDTRPEVGAAEFVAPEPRGR